MPALVGRLKGRFFRSTHPMQFSVYLQGPLPEKAPHKISRALAGAALRCRLARSVGQNAIQITSGLSIRELKDQLRGVRGPEVEQINPPGYHCLPYTYPLPYHLLRSYHTVPYLPQPYEVSASDPAI